MNDFRDNLFIQGCLFEYFLSSILINEQKNTPNIYITELIYMIFATFLYSKKYKGINIYLIIISICSISLMSNSIYIDTYIKILITHLVNYVYFDMLNLNNMEYFEHGFGRNMLSFFILY